MVFTQRRKIEMATFGGGGVEIQTDHIILARQAE